MTEITNPWLQYLTQHGGKINAATPFAISGFDAAPNRDALTRGFVAPLTDIGLISVSGEDAASFLHNQLTNDVEHLGLNEARLAGYCTAKGRLLASFLMCKSADAILLQLPREIQGTVQKRLQMFVLRAKAKLNDASDAYAILGIGGENAASALASRFPQLPDAPFGKTESTAGILVRLPDALGMPRFQWIAPIEAAQQAWPELAQSLTPVGTDVWRLTEIHAGIPLITKATQEQFVPQMVNFELIGGVNFKKGCYPGQEIVARSQYLGKLKRRMLLASIDNSAASAGMEVFSSADPGQPCGMIVNAEANLQGGTDCLVELKTAAADEGSVHLGSAEGPALRFSNLPYTLPA